MTSGRWAEFTEMVESGREDFSIIAFAKRGATTARRAAQVKSLIVTTARTGMRALACSTPFPFPSEAPRPPTQAEDCDSLFL